MKTYPKISLIFPSYNKGDFTEIALKSALDQNYPNLELIVIDGASNDDTRAILEKYSAHFAYYVSEPDSGECEALNKGFAKATGEIWAILNADDILMPKSLFNVAEIFSSFPQVQWITGKPVTIDENTSIKKVSEHYLPHKELFFYNTSRTIQLESTFWRKELSEKAGVGVNPDYHPAQDHQMWSRFYQHTPLYIVHTVLGAFRKSEASSTTSDHEFKARYVKRLLETKKEYRTGLWKYISFYVLYGLCGLSIHVSIERRLRKLVRKLFFGSLREIHYDFIKSKWIAK
ncbi:MAG: glycosyltransferase [Candidatus Nomurabacteria bacterium]|nr:glycosyltransferase [Candidatus Nomurabacteria bacterium]